MVRGGTRALCCGRIRKNSGVTRVHGARAPARPGGSSGARRLIALRASAPREKKPIPKPLPKRSKRAWGRAKGGAAIGCRFRGSLRRHGVFGSRFFFSLRRRFVFCTFVAAQRACFFRENDPYRFVGRSADEGRVLHESATATGEDVLPGFTCRVGDLPP